MSKKGKETPPFLLLDDFVTLHLQDRLADLIIFDRMHGRKLILPSKNTGLNLIKSMKFYYS